MKLLLTGVDGQVGFELFHSLQPFAEVIPSVLREGRGTVAMDLSDYHSIVTTLNQVRPDIIVNPAAYTAVDKAETNVELAKAINSTAPAIIGEWAAKHHARVVHFSTDYVFAGEGTVPYREDDRCAPLNVYGQTKLDGDLALLSSGCQCMIFRTSGVFGSYGQNFVKTMLRLGKQREMISVVDDQYGAPTSARVLADTVAQILGRFDWRLLISPPAVFHLTCSGETSWYGFAEEIFRLARQYGVELKLTSLKPIPSSDYPLPAARPKNWRLDCTKIRNQFNVRQVPWQDALEQTFMAILGFGACR